MSVQIFTLSETVLSKRDFCFMLVDETDGITPELLETNGQPQIRKPGESSWTNTENTLLHVGNGHYIISLTTTELNKLGVFSVRYKSANTAEFQEVGYIQSNLSGNTDSIKALLLRLIRKVDWIEYTMLKAQKRKVMQQELGVL